MNDLDSLTSHHDAKSMQTLLQSRAAELFKLCDIEDKGFINKKDIQRMKEPLGLSPELLEEVFDSLDMDKNGYLTLDEFTIGFSSYLGSQVMNDNEEIVEMNIEQEEEDAVFRETMDSLGASELIEGDSSIKDLWLRLRHDDPIILKRFEDFISNVSQEIKRSKTDFSILESALQSKSNVYDEHVRKLYEEMEAQIKAEKARIVAQEKFKEKELKEKLEKDLREKEKQLQESLNRQVDMEQKLSKLNSLEYQQKVENERLLKEKAMLEEQLQESVKCLQDSKSYINVLQQQTKEEKRNRANQALKVTENIALEKENLARELNMLKDLNKKLQDERDELQLMSASSPRRSFDRSERQLTKQDSILSNYIRPNSLSIDVEEMHLEHFQMVTAESYSEDESTYAEPKKVTNIHTSKPLSLKNYEIATMKREQPVGANATIQYSEIMNVPPNTTPQRVFKIVFIGDSGVGKTSFVQRFCNDTFRESFSTTIGVDFQVKSIIIDNRVIALQLWDTAGQERYRSITKQYFRKADGVICMYDVTSEQSFKNLRNWISSMRECASEDCLLTIIGNKIDLCETDDTRVVKYKDGAALADEQGCLFFETSSKESKYVIETMEAIARILTEKEDKQIEDVLNLRTKEKKKGCC